MLRLLNKYIILLAFVMGSNLLIAQKYDKFNIQELTILKNTTNTTTPQTIHKVNFGLNKKSHIVNYTLGPFMFLYQKLISPQISAQCLYEPSCSQFSQQLFKQYNPLKAFLSTVDRLMRCDRISATDIRTIQIDEHDHKKHESVLYYSSKKPTK